MAGYVINIEKATMQNDNFRKVLNTAQHSQLVVMSLLPGEEMDDWAVVIPAGVEHNVINTSDSEKMKLYSIYSPPEHPEGTVHPTKADDTGHDH
jgi:mannose-6-phosphate isomerase-like protein (cupin superfamily)